MIRTKMPSNNYEANRYFHRQVPSPEYARPATLELQKLYNPTDIFQTNAKKDFRNWPNCFTFEKHGVVLETVQTQSMVREFLRDAENDSVMQGLTVFKVVNGRKYKMLQYNSKGRRIFCAVDLPE